MTFNRADLYQTVTDQIVAQIEAGTLPWLRPWAVSNKGDTSLPHNAATGRPYSGVNVMLLWATAASRGYASNGWMAYRQAEGKGAQVRKGETGTTITFVKVLERTNAEGEDERIPMLRAYTVFNVAQIDGLPEAAPAAPVTEIERHAAADAMIRATGAVIHHRGDAAFYSPATDTITLPVAGAFETPAHYYATAAHELVHWTGSKHRLDRTFGKRFGDAAYAAEELVAEIGAAYVCATLGIEGKLRHADYVASWLKVLKADKRAIFTAASAASKAADLLLGSAEALDVEEAA